MRYFFFTFEERGGWGWGGEAGETLSTSNFFPSLFSFSTTLYPTAAGFPSEVEFAFGYLQVFSAIAVIFAHGSNEVG